MVPKQTIVCGTTVLLYPGRIGQSDLLPALFSSVHVPEQVLLEFDMSRLLNPETINPCSLA
jgi:predicted nucleic acid-binding protein